MWIEPGTHPVSQTASIVNTTCHVTFNLDCDCNAQITAQSALPALDYISGYSEILLSCLCFSASRNLVGYAWKVSSRQGVGSHFELRGQRQGIKPEWRVAPLCSLRSKTMAEAGAEVPHYVCARERADRVKTCQKWDVESKKRAQSAWLKYCREIERDRERVGGRSQCVSVCVCAHCESTDRAIWKMSRALMNNSYDNINRYEATWKAFAVERFPYNTFYGAVHQKCPLFRWF